MRRSTASSSIVGASAIPRPTQTTAIRACLMATTLELRDSYSGSRTACSLRPPPGKSFLLLWSQIRPQSSLTVGRDIRRSGMRSRITSTRTTFRESSSFPEICTRARSTTGSQLAFPKCASRNRTALGVAQQPDREPGVRATIAPSAPVSG